MKRVFIAVHVPPNDALRRVLRDLEAWGTALRPVRPDQLHLTLRFLGQIEESALAVLPEKVAEAAQDIGAFAFGLRGLRVLPHERRPRVIYAAVEHEQPLVQLAARLGEPQPFTPHLTLARVKARLPHDWRNLSDRHRDQAWGTVQVTTLDVMASELTWQGPIHTRIAAVPLGP
jgi:2'-5' RNA ligase